jgi:hypothetical protein
MAAPSETPAEPVEVDTNEVVEQPEETPAAKAFAAMRKENAALKQQLADREAAEAAAQEQAERQRLEQQGEYQTLAQQAEAARDAEKARADAAEAQLAKVREGVTSSNEAAIEAMTDEQKARLDRLQKVTGTEDPWQVQALIAEVRAMSSQPAEPPPKQPPGRVNSEGIGPDELTAAEREALNAMIAEGNALIGKASPAQQKRAAQGRIKRRATRA